MAKKVCKKCGEDNWASASMCVVCGESLKSCEIVGENTEAIDGVSGKRICSQCGEEIKVNSTNCPYCGGFVSKVKKSNKVPMSCYQNEKNDKSNVLIYILSFLIPLVGLIWGGIFLMKEDSYKKESGTICIILALISWVIRCVYMFYR